MGRRQPGDADAREPADSHQSAHISTIYHITVEELKARLAGVDLRNGFANRILFAITKRVRNLPFGGWLRIPDLGEKLSRIVDVATGNPLSVTYPQKLPERVVMTGAARTFSEPTYDALMTERHGLLGAVTARGATQVLRVALIYALLDGLSRGRRPPEGGAGGLELLRRVRGHCLRRPARRRDRRPDPRRP